MPTTRETYPKRYESNEIATWNMSKNNRCEACGDSIHKHDYVVLDNLGYVVECSND